MAEQLQQEGHAVKLGGHLIGVNLEKLKIEEIERQRVFRQDLAEWLAAQSLGADVSRVPLHRYVVSEIHVATAPDSDQANLAILLAFEKFLNFAGLEPSIDDSHPVFASVHFRRVRRTKTKKTSAQLEERLRLIETALSNGLRRQGSMINELNAQDDPDGVSDVLRMARADAEYEKLRAEIDQIKAETTKADAETKKTEAETKKTQLEAKKELFELAHTVAKALIKASAAFSIVIGGLVIAGVPVPVPHTAKPSIVFKIDSERVGPNQKREVTGSVWIRDLEKGMSPKNDQEHDPLDPE
jgi:SMC interacting uncharacterized protein involved in chromosome segregation